MPPQSSYVPQPQPPAGNTLAPAGSSYLEGPDPLERSIAEGYKTPAERAARIQQLRLKTGLAPGLIERNFDQLDREDRAGGISVDTLRKTDPGLAQWLARDPLNAAAAQDDIPKLQDINRTFRASDPLMRGIDQLQSMLYGFVEWSGETTGSRTLTTFGREGRTRNQAEAELYGKAPKFADAFDSPGAFASWAYNTLGEQLPQMAPTLAGGGIGAAYGSTFGPGGTVIGGLIGAFVPGLVMGIGETQQNVKDLDPTAEAPLAVLAGGTAIAALDSALPGKVGSKLVRTFGQETAEQVARRVLMSQVKPRHLVRDTVTGAVTGMATEGLTEAVQEAIGAIAAAQGVGVDVNWEQLRQQMLEAGAAGALMGGVFEGGASAVENRRQRARAAIAEQQQAFFTAIGQATTDSKLLERLPEAGRQLVEQITKDGPVETVYLPVKQAEEYFQSKGLDAGVWAELVTGDRNALENAKRDQGDEALLAIPIADYAAKVAPTEHQSFFARELKLNPQLANVREVQERVEREAARVQQNAVRDEAGQAARAEIARRFTELSVERGAPRWQAEAWGTFVADRYVERARRKGVDALQLFEQQPREIVIQEASGAVLPGVVETDPGDVVGIAASVAAPGESSVARAARRRAHVAALASRLVRDARRIDPNVDPAQIRAELEFRMDFAEEQQAATRESGTGQDLLRAIAGYGGVWWEAKTGAYKGEIEHLRESGRDIKGVKAGTGRVVHQAGRATYAGVPGVYREDGLTPDGMVEALRQDARFSYITDINDLFDALDRAQRASADVDQFPGTDELEELGIRPGVKWWSDTWRDVEQTADVEQTSGEVSEDLLGDQALEPSADEDVDTSFNPDEFQQLLEQHDTPIARIETLPDAAEFSERGAKAVPFPHIADGPAEQLYRASFALATAQPVERTIALKDVIATQSWVFPDKVREYLEAEGEFPPALAMFYQGRYYLTDGTHRAAAAWARGEQLLQARVVDVDELQLARELQVPEGATAGPIVSSPAGQDLPPRIGAAYVAATPEQRAAAEQEGLEASQRIEAAREAARAEIDRQFAAQQQLEEQEQPELFQLDERNTPAGFEVVASHLTESELARLRRDTAERLLAVWETLPLDQDFEDAAIAGAAKRGWYERSGRALQAVFGPVDAPRFAALLAALSPQTSVEQNLLNTVRMWTKWDNAGRPTRRAAIEKLLSQSVAGESVESVLSSWLPNVIRALTTKDAGTIRLSGPKVSSFTANLLGDLQEVTNDAWMANFALVEATVLKGKPHKVGRQKLAGKNPGYLALSAKIRRVARTLTRKTGVEWTPAHVQETVWSWAKTLYELADAEGQKPSQVLKEGGLTDAAIAQTPDFAQLFVSDAPVRDILEAAGYGDVLSALEKATRRIARGRDAATAAARAGQGGRITPGLLRSAKRLDELQRRRTEQSLAARLERQAQRETKAAAARRAARKARVARKAGGEFYQELKAPTRQPRLRQTDTPAFTKWFDGSAVTDPDGEPRVVYHATDQDFETFERSDDIGFHFGDRLAANIRAAHLAGIDPEDMPLADPDGYVQPGLAGVNVMPVYLSIKNPLRLPDLGLWEPSEVLAHLVGAGVISNDERLDMEERGEIVDRELVRDLLTRAGYDGIVYTNRTEGGGDSWIAISPNQIKSATGNRGTFSNINPSIARETNDRQLRRALERVSEQVYDLVHKETGLTGFDGVEFQAYLDEHGEIYLDLIELPHQAQGQGLGRRMIEALQKVANAHGVPIVIDARPEAIGFFETLGFTADDRGHREELGSLTQMMWEPPRPPGVPARGVEELHSNYKPQTPEEFDRINREVSELVDSMVEKEGGAAAGIAMHAHLDQNGDIYLDLIMVPTELQGKGIGSRLVQGLVAYADLYNLRVSVDPSPNQGKKAALDRFYKRFGFIKNGTARFYDAGATGSRVRPSLTERRPPEARRRRYKPAAPPFISDAELATRTELVTTGSREIGVSVIRSADDVAAAMQFLARGASERLDGLVTDADGKPLAIVGSFKGRVDQAPAFPDTLLAEALQVPGAARIYVVHNHPSGDANLSTADKLLNAAFVRLFKDTGIEHMGVMAIGAGELGAQVYQFQDNDAQLHDGIVRLEEPVGSIPIRERELVATGKLEEGPLNGPAQAQQAAARLLGPRFGVLFLDTRMRPIGAVPMDPAQAETLREKGRLQELLTTKSIVNPSSAIVWTPMETQVKAAVNVANALKAHQVEVLDVASPFTSLQAMNPALSASEQLTGEFFQPDEPGGIRGAFNPRTGRIRLIAGAQDLSTFLHESGHAFLDELMADALEVDIDTATDLQKGLVRDAQTALKWLGFEGTIADFQGLSVDDRRGMHEQWARGFEAYLMTGEAPSLELREVFAKFRAWLTAVYRVIRGRVRDRATAEQLLNVPPLGEEIRGVMDRLLASDEAIAAVRAEGQVDALFTDAASAGVDELTFAAYQQQIVEANRRAREALDRRLLEDWRRERAAWWQEERERVRQAIEDEAAKNPVFIALSVIRTGKLPDGSIPAFGDGRPLKLSKRDIVRMKGEAFAKRLPKPYVYTVDGGLHPDVVAELVGFSSGDALLESLIGARPMKPLVDAEADRLMREKHGDLLLDGLELKDLAEQAVHEHRAEVISAELKELTKGMAAAQIPTAPQLRQAAIARIRTMKVRELRPGLFLQAAQRASQQAFDAFAKNDRAAAVKFKQQELTSLALFRAAGEAKERAHKSAQLLKAFQTSAGRRRTLLHAGQDYLDQVDAILERLEFTKTSQKQIDRRTSLRKFVEAQIEKGLPLTIPDSVIDDARQVNYTQLTVEELEGVRSAVEQIHHAARLKDKLLKAQDQRTLAEIVGNIAGSIRAHFETRPRNLEPRSPRERARKFVGGIAWAHRKIASIARELDGFQDGGPMFDHVIRQINGAGDREASMNAAAGVRLRELFRATYSPSELAGMNTKRRIPEIDQRNGGIAEDVSLSKQALLMLALNQGNETNRQRLRDGYGWTQEQIQKALDNHLEKRDWEFVQGVWDYIDTFWPQIVEKQQRVVGVPPEKVLATPVFTRFGEFRGGYFPIKFERELSGRIANLEEANAADMQKAAAYVHATTARGHLERRVDGPVTEHPVRLDFGVIFEHVGQVIHDLTHHEMLIDVGRILGSKEVESAIRETLGIEAFDQFRSALKDIALGDVAAKHEGEGLLRYLRNGATVVGLGWNGMTTALQLLGFNQSIKRVGAKWVAKGVGSFMRGAVAMDGTVKAVMAESEFMRNRINTQSPEVASIRKDLGIDTGRFSGGLDAILRKASGDVVTRQAIADSFLFMITRAQLLVDIPTYLGARAKAAADPANLRDDGTLDEDKVIAIAEQAVLDAQGGGQIKDLASIQRGSPAWKIWTNFYSFFNTTFNLYAESLRQNGKRAIAGNPVAIGRLAVDFFILFTAPTVMNHLLRSALTGSLLDELEDPEELIKDLAAEQLAYMLGTMVVLRELGGVIQGYSSYEGPAGARGVAAAVKLVKQVQQGELDEAFWRSLNQAAGVLFHYPAGQVDRTVRGIGALMDGTTQNPAAVVFGPPPER